MQFFSLFSVSEELEAGGCPPEEMRWLVPSTDSSIQVQYYT
jgi:hypothetical protein